MNPNPIIRRAPWLAPIACFGLPFAPAQTTIYSDNFDGDNSNIHTVAPDVRPGTETWTASPIFNADGSLDRPATSAAGSMTLPFVPADGFIYTLDASVSGVNGDTDWIGLGFANGQSSGTGSNNRFLTPGPPLGSSWMLFRGSNPDPVATNGNKIQKGLGQTTPSDWLAFAAQNGGNIQMRIVLDTTGGAGAWTATWYAKLPADSDYTLVGATSTIPHAASSYTSVGIAASNTAPGDAASPGAGGTIESFSLTAEGAASLPAITDIEIDGSGNVILTLDGPAAGLTVQQSGNLAGFTDVASTADGNTLKIDAADVDPDADGKDFFRVRD